MGQTTTKPTGRYQCRDCIYAYDPAVGDLKQGISPGTPFEDLPDYWVCPVCRASKRRFISSG